jgi:hypothetical protein
MNRPEADIFHQSIKLFETRKFEFGRPSANMLIRRSQSGSGPVQIARITDGEHHNLGARPMILSDDMTQSTNKDRISTAIQERKSNRGGESESPGSQDVDPAQRSLFGAQVARSVAASFSATSFPLYDRIDRTASAHSTTYSQFIVDPAVGSQVAKTTSAGAQRIVRDPVANNGATTESVIHQPVPNIVRIAPRSAADEFGSDRLLNSSNINRFPSWSPRVRAFSTPGVGNKEPPPRSPGAPRDTNPTTAKRHIPTTLGTIDGGSSVVSESAPIGNATKHNPSDTDDSVALHRGSIGAGDGDDQATESSGVTGELWLDTVSLRNWIQAYFVGEFARGSRATNQFNAAF